MSNYKTRVTSRLPMLSLLLVLVILISAIPINQVYATASQRNKAISTMSSMRNFSWVPNGSVTIYNKQYAIGGSITGLPYTQNADTTLSGFKSSPTMEYIYLGGNYYYFSQPSADIGNDCTSAVAIALSAGGSAIVVSECCTDQMLRAIKVTENKMTKRGTYISSKAYTDNIVSGVSTSTLYGSLVAGDVCFYKLSTGGGHAILITSVSGTNVNYIEQIGAGSSRLTTTHSTWTNGTKSFDALKAQCYVALKSTDI